MTAEREIVVEVRLPLGSSNVDIASTLRMAARRVFDLGDDSGAWSDGSRYEIRRPVAPPSNACRMCSASVAWSPLCSACCGAVERVEEAITSAGGVISHREIAGRLAYGPRGRPRQRCLDSYLIHAAIDELVYRGRVATGRSAVSLTRMVRLVRTEAA